ncbi:hypothetical protein H0A71_20185 [Alcaligenaceae bacterium]|nr:hypothetical protein [Alcaligenaceae bacterium]
MRKAIKFSPEVRERAVRLLQEHRSKYPPPRKVTWQDDATMLAWVSSL